MTTKKGRPKAPVRLRRDKQTIVYLTSVQRQELQKIATRSGATISAVVYEAVVKYLSDQYNNDQAPNDSLMMPTEYAQMVASQIVQALLDHGFSHSTHTDHIQLDNKADGVDNLNIELTDFIKNYDL